MKKKSLVTIFCVLFYTASSYAQIWKRVQQSIEKKAAEKVDNVLNGKGKASSEAGSSAHKSAPKLEEHYSFVPGNMVIFETDFAQDAKGRMPKKWKSNGSGSIATVPDEPGNWLALSEQTTYKIDSLFKLPENFTIEFDLLTRSSETADIGAMSFGFARDNSAKNHLTDAHNGNAITNTQLHFHNQEVIHSSSDTDIYNTLEFPFASYSNSVIKVAIAVEGEQLRVYLDKIKVLDTKMFKTEAVKFFYLTAPYSYEHSSKVYFGNFMIKK